MGGGTWTEHDYSSYSRSVGKTYNTKTKITSNQTWNARCINENLNPKNVIRECINTKEHPNTIPIILAFDVTGSMGNACKKTATALGVIMTDLYKKYKDVEIMIAGIGDFEWDDAPLQVSHLI